MTRNSAPRTALLFTAACGLQACAGSPASLSMMSDENLRAQSSYTLCNAWAFGGHSEDSRAYQVLQKRDELTEREWRAAKEGKIFVGMSELGLVCSWGSPGVYGDINESNYGNGVERQWVYRQGSYGGAQYVYTEQNKIVAWN